MHEESPTTNIIIFPYPVNTFVPLSNTGEGILFLPATFLDP
jgi:hypothetical protein